MKRKWILYKNKLWNPSKQNDIDLVNFIETNLLNLEKRTFNHYNGNIYGYFDANDYFYFNCHKHYNSNIVDIFYNSFLIFEKLENYSNEKEIDSLMKYITKTYYHLTVGNIEHSKLSLKHSAYINEKNNIY